MLSRCRMKTVLLLRSVICAAVFGSGILTARFVLPQAQLPGTRRGGPNIVSRSEEEGNRPAQLKSSGAFDGTVGGLLRLAKGSRLLLRAEAKLFLVLEPLPAAQIAGLVKAFPLRSIPLWHENAVMNALLQQWAEKDADGALKWAAGLPKVRQHEVRLTILRNVAATDAERALALANRVMPAADRAELLAGIAEMIADADPEKALRLLQTGDRAFRNNRFTAIFKSWALRDPAEAWARALKLGPADRYNACQAVMGVYASTDPRAALELSRSLPAGMRDPVMFNVFSTWAYNDSEAARVAATALPTASERNRALNAVLSQLAVTDGPAALKAALAMPGGAGRDGLIERVFSCWSSVDPALAATSLVALPWSGRQKRDALSSAVNAWAQRDPQAAMEWAKGLSVKDGQHTAMNQAMYNLSIADLPAATLAWKGMPADQRRTYLSTLVSNWTSADSEGAVAFARSLENPQERVNALSTCASSLGFQNPEALTALINEIPAGIQRTRAIRSLVSDPFGNGGADAAAWLRTMPEAERTAVLQNGEGNWSEFNNPKEMKALLEETPGLSDRTQLWATTARGLASENPGAALQWAQAIQNPAAQRDSINAVFQEWAQRDPSAALAQAHTLTDSELQKSSVRGVIETWASQEPEAVLAWAAGAAGEEREFALLKGSLANAESDPAASAKIVNDLLAAKNAHGNQAPLASAAAQVARAWLNESIPDGTHGPCNCRKAPPAMMPCPPSWTAGRNWIRWPPARGSSNCRPARAAMPPPRR